MKKYNINLHYDAVINVDVVANSLEEAEKIASNNNLDLARAEMSYNECSELECEEMDLAELKDHITEEICYRCGLNEEDGREIVDQYFESHPNCDEEMDYNDLEWEIYYNATNK